MFRPLPARSRSSTPAGPAAEPLRPANRPFSTQDPAIGAQPIDRARPPGHHFGRISVTPGARSESGGPPASATGVIQAEKKTPPKRLAELRQKRVVTHSDTVSIPIKTAPKHPTHYPSTRVYGGRTYHYRTDPQGRLEKISGPLTYTNAGRVATMKVPNKRRSDQSGHLFAHSLGGPPRLNLNYVAMNRRINSAGGEWGKMEGYIRARMKQRGTRGWMSVKPDYPRVAMKRPHRIRVRARFNRSPYVVHFLIPTP